MNRIKFQAYFERLISFTNAFFHCDVYPVSNEISDRQI